MSDIELIERVKSNDEKGLLELVSKYDKVYFSMAKKYINFVDFDFEREKYLFFYKTANDFDAQRGMKFTSFLASRTKFLCKTLSYKKKVHIELEDIYAAAPQKYIPNEELKIMKLRMKELDNIRAKKILLKRYFSAKNKIVPFSEIAEKLQMSTRNVKYIHDRYINFIRKSKKNV